MSMMSDQNREAYKRAREHVKKYLTPIIITSLVLTGVIEEIQILHKHQAEKAIAVAVLYFVFMPLLVIGFRKLIGPMND